MSLRVVVPVMVEFAVWRVRTDGTPFAPNVPVTSTSSVRRRWRWPPRMSATLVKSGSAPQAVPPPSTPASPSTGTPAFVTRNGRPRRPSFLADRIHMGSSARVGSLIAVKPDRSIVHQQMVSGSAGSMCRNTLPVTAGAVGSTVITRRYPACKAMPPCGDTLVSGVKLALLGWAALHRGQPQHVRVAGVGDDQRQAALASASLNN